MHVHYSAPALAQLIQAEWAEFRRASARRICNPHRRNIAYICVTTSSASFRSTTRIKSCDAVFEKLGILQRFIGSQMHTATKETRDVIDALVLDLHNRRATRANDLWLEEENGKLLLKAADASSLAILRRLSHGLFGSGPSRAAYDWKYIEFLRGDPHAVKNGAGYHMRIERLPPGEIAGLCRGAIGRAAGRLLTLKPSRRR